MADAQSDAVLEQQMAAELMIGNLRLLVVAGADPEIDKPVPTSLWMPAPAYDRQYAKGIMMFPQRAQPTSAVLQLETEIGKELIEA